LYGSGGPGGSPVRCGDGPYRLVVGGKRKKNGAGVQLSAVGDGKVRRQKKKITGKGEQRKASLVQGDLGGFVGSRGGDGTRGGETNERAKDGVGRRPEGKKEDKGVGSPGRSTVVAVGGNPEERDGAGEETGDQVESELGRPVSLLSENNP